MRKYLSMLAVIVTLGLGVIGSTIAARPAFAGPGDDGAAFDANQQNCGGPSGRSCN
jgi:hypothetical protein